MRSETRGSSFYRCVIIVVGMGLTLLSAGIGGFEEALLTVLYTVQAVGFETRRLEFQQGALSLSSGIILAALVTAGLPVALLVISLSYLLSDLWLGNLGSDTLFNSAQAVMATLGAVLFYLRAGGITYGTSMVFLGAHLVFAVCYFCINHALIGTQMIFGANHISMGQYITLIRLDFVISSFSLVAGILLIASYHRWGPIAVLGFVLPTAAMAKGLRAWYEHTLSQRDVQTLRRALDKDRSTDQMAVVSHDRNGLENRGGTVVPSATRLSEPPVASYRGHGAEGETDCSDSENAGHMVRLRKEPEP